jgi:prepilin-type N-terminal cleavage/methylation domain-containing protein
MKSVQANSQRGFTLVEIAIVLVIIGLLLGGILKGQEMITQAKIKNIVADFSGVSAAYYGYQDRYRAIPGDDPNAGTRWGATPGGGNGQVGGKYNSQTATKPARARSSRSMRSRASWAYKRATPAPQSARPWAAS